MRSCLILWLWMAASFTAWAQQPGPAPAASGAQENAAGSGEQTAKAKQASVIGCLSGPDENGAYLLRSMQHRDGIWVMGRDDLRERSGAKVKLTGTWLPAEAGMAASIKPRFQATAVEVLAAKCKPPAETTPVSKHKPPKPSAAESAPK